MHILVLNRIAIIDYLRQPSTRRKLTTFFNLTLNVRIFVNNRNLNITKNKRQSYVHD